LLNDNINQLVVLGKEKYTLRFSIPKMHQMEHFPENILLNGPPIYTSTFAFEAFHKYAADGVHTNQNHEASLIRRYTNVTGNLKMKKNYQLNKNGKFLYY
jgi:hypothetical protein